MIVIGRFKGLEIYLDNALWLRDKDGIVYSRYGDLELDLNYLRLTKNKPNQLLVLDKDQGWWQFGINYSSHCYSYDAIEFRKFIFSNEKIKDILIIQDILE